MLLKGHPIRAIRLAAIVLAALGASACVLAQRGVLSGSGPEWWSLQPISRPAPPTVRDKAWARNPIDAFVLEKLEAKGLHPAPPADRATLIRRATFDLTGLPPTPHEIDTFVSDRSPVAYEKLIDRLLASPHYGERWARHWMDVARFCESHGFEYDKIRDHAWRYRDYLIQAFNEDKPFDRFIDEQIAGDVIPGAGNAGIIATGFLVCGPMDEAGKSAPGELVRQRAREEEMEDMIGTVGQTFLGLTVNCARCHDHKFDPIPQRDYYRLKAALDGVNPGTRVALTAAELSERAARKAEMQHRIDRLRERLANIESPARLVILQSRGLKPSHAPPAPILRWSFEKGADDDSGSIHGELLNGSVIAGGRLKLAGNAMLRSAALPRSFREKTLEAWVYLKDLAQHGGSALTIEMEGGVQFDAIVFGERERGKWIAGSEGFQRTRDLDSPVEASQAGELIHMAITYDSQNRITVYRNGRRYAESYVPSGASGTLRGYPEGKSHVLFGLRHTGAQDYLSGEIEEARIYDRALSPAEIAASFESAPFTVSESELEAVLSPAQKAQRAGIRVGLDEAAAAMNALNSPPQTYAAISVQPGPVRILRRGDVQLPGDEVGPGALSGTRSCPGDFALANTSTDAERRLKLAKWISSPANPLTARVMVNRIWQYHFGRGIIGTPNDFGFNGDRPTHRELLDWLATTFQQGAERGKPWSVKATQRLIMLSSTYRQSSSYDPKAASVDADDRYLWRFAPRRLEAEAVRDSMLAISGQLNPAIGGPGFRPFTVQTFGSNFYSLVDSAEPGFNRRTIYRTVVQSARSPLLESLDCPDPSTKTPRRTATTTPIQAMEMMNDSFVLRQARKTAERIKREAGADSKGQIGLLYRLAYGREPKAEELRRAVGLVKGHGLEHLCWAVLNSSEFIYTR